MKAGFHPLNWGLGPGKHRGAWGCSHPEPVPGQSCMMGGAVFLWPSTCHAEPGTRPPSPRVISCLWLQPAPCTAGRLSTRPGPQHRQALFRVSLSSCRGTDRGATAMTRWGDQGRFAEPELLSGGTGPRGAGRVWHLGQWLWAASRVLQPLQSWQPGTWLRILWVWPASPLSSRAPLACLHPLTSSGCQQIK